MLSDLDPFWFLCLWHLCYQGISETSTDQRVWNSPEVVGEGRYAPFQRGGRFSEKALGPSTASEESIAARYDSTSPARI